MDEREQRGARAPINAMRAAKAAARATSADDARAARAAASGTVRAKARSPRLRREQEATTATRRVRIKPLAVLLGCALAVAFIVVMGGAVREAFLYEESPAEVAERELAQNAVSEPESFCSAKLSDTYELQGSVYALEKGESGGYRFTCTARSAEGDESGDGAAASASTLAGGSGKPVAFAYKDGTFFLLVQCGKQWRVVSLVAGSGSLPVNLAKGKGRAKALALEDDELKVELKGGSSATVDTE